jgi:hypothetical protein
MWMIYERSSANKALQLTPSRIAPISYNHSASIHIIPELGPAFGVAELGVRLLYMKTIVIICSFGLCAALYSAPLLDQQQPLIDATTSTSNTPGYGIWQSFTPGIDGSLSQIEMAFSGDFVGAGTLNIYEGEGTTGTLLSSYSVQVDSSTITSWNNWSVNVPVNSGSKYTFLFVNTSHLTTHDLHTEPVSFAVQMHSNDLYTFGTAGGIDPSSSFILPSLDVAFKTFVTVPEPSCFQLLLLAIFAYGFGRTRRCS